MKDQIELKATLDLIRDAVFIVPNLGDIWEDFGYWLEVTGFMTAQTMKYKNWGEIRMIFYVIRYFRKCFKDYK